MTITTLHTTPIPHETNRPVRGLLAVPALPIPAALERYLQYRRTVAGLEACSDRVLGDLAIARADIPRLAREAVAAQGS